MKRALQAMIVLALPVLFCGQSGAGESDLVWSTFLGGSSYEYAMSIALDDFGNIHVGGYTESNDFPTTTGAYDTSYRGWTDGFICKLEPTGSELIFSTLIGGDYRDYLYAITLDNTGNIYTTGHTNSVDFPTTAGAYDTIHNGYDDIFIAKLNPHGSVLNYSTFLGGRRDDRGFSIAVDNFGKAYVTGNTLSSNFPTTSQAFDTTWGESYDVFVAKLSTTGSALEYSSFLGGSDWDIAFGIALDDAGDTYVTGWTLSPDFPTTVGAYDSTHNGSQDLFAAKLNATGSSLEYSTFIGGDDLDCARGLAVDDSGHAYLTGSTHSDDFPTTAGAFDTTFNGAAEAIVIKLDLTGSALVYSTLLGGNEYELGHSIIVDDFGDVLVTGRTRSTNFPTTAGAFDDTHNGDDDVFVIKFDPEASALDYATFLGGSSFDLGLNIAMDGLGNAYVCGGTGSVEFPTTAGVFDATYNGGDSDAFVAKLRLGGTPVVAETPIAGLPKTYTLYQNYPNPFNTSTEIRYHIPQDGHVTLKVFNTLGQQVRTLADADQCAGEYTVAWDGRDDGGREASSGLYFCRLKANSSAKTIKMVLVR